MAAYARALLNTMAQERSKAEATISGNDEALVEPLTERELDVLRLLAANLSNAEIAE